jgi:hypothetical protein
MKRFGKTHLVAMLTAVIAMAGGCSVLSPQEDHTRYFMLMPTGGENSIAPAEAATTGRD